MKREHKIEAQALLTAHMETIRKRSFPDLLKLIDDADVIEMSGQTGKNYLIEVNGFWDDKQQTRLRVCGSIDDGGLRAYINWRPLVTDFLAYPDGTTE